MSARRIALRVVYWLAVLIVSLAIVFTLVLLFESLDDAGIEGDGGDQQEQPPPSERQLERLPDLGPDER
jgi:hypothetical protein